MDGVNERERNRDTGEEGGEWDGWRDWTLEAWTDEAGEAGRGKKAGRQGEATE